MIFDPEGLNLALNEMVQDDISKLLISKLVKPSVKPPHFEISF